MKRIYILVAFCLFEISYTCAQDIIVFKNGDEIEAKVLEVAAEEIKYKKHAFPDGPVYVGLKTDLFMIKFENGTREVFSISEIKLEEESVKTGTGSATLYFIRPKKFSASKPKILVGTAVPDEVIVKLKNGRWYKVEYKHVGKVEFLTGIYYINPETFDFDIKPGETYYFYCEPISIGFKDSAEIKELNKDEAESYMSKLKEQTDSMVGK